MPFVIGHLPLDDGDTIATVRRAHPEERIAIFKAGGGRFCADVRNVNVHVKGHFCPWENPGAWIRDLRATYRDPR